MFKSKIFYFSIFGFAVFSALLIFSYLNKTILAEPSLKEFRNPCWFKGYEDKSITYDEIMAYQNREMSGYSKDVPLESAVKKFNQEMRCYSHYDEFSELTEDEVIASLISFDSLNDKPNFSEPRRNERFKVITDRTLPKGSLLRFDSGTCREIGSFLPRDLCAKGLRISLILNLDKKEDVKIPSLNEDIFLIRKNFPKFEPRQ